MFDFFGTSIRKRDWLLTRPQEHRKDFHDFIPTLEFCLQQWNRFEVLWCEAGLKLKHIAVLDVNAHFKGDIDQILTPSRSKHRFFLVVASLLTLAS